MHNAMESCTFLMLSTFIVFLAVFLAAFAISLRMRRQPYIDFVHTAYSLRCIEAGKKAPQARADCTCDGHDHCLSAYRWTCTCVFQPDMLPVFVCDNSLTQT